MLIATQNRVYSPNQTDYLTFMCVNNLCICESVICI